MIYTLFLLALALTLLYVSMDFSYESKVTKSSKPVLLIDMDGVIADYYARFLLVWKLRHPTRFVIEPADLKNMYFESDYPKEFTYDIRDITCGPGFFESLPPMEGAAEVLNRIMDEDEFEVFLCSTPDTGSVNHGCTSEKVRWVERVLGKRWLKRMVLTHDKTLVSGDFLIDDKPDIKGVNNRPTWDHVVFTHSYNKHVKGHRLNNWAEWEKLKPVLLKSFNNSK